MAINIRQKGAGGEQEVALELNAIIFGVYMELGMAVPTKPIVQRNQNQTAVGGRDLIGTFGLAIEVKRQEDLSINSWWAQCIASAKEIGETPVLLFRQNGKKWRCIMEVQVQIGESVMITRGEIAFADFKVVFRRLVLQSFSGVKVVHVDHPTLFA